jgi:ABC-2 type transport system ATP-binding protein
LLGARPGTPAFAVAVRQVGTLIEGPALYGRATARQNMRIEADALGLRNASAEIDELLDLVGLSARADTKAKSFSLGMKQRLGLALALLGRPRLVVLDEPTNGLDPAGIVEIRELIKQLPERGTTVLVSSHLLSEVQLMCDRAAILQRGKLIAEGTIDELLATNGGSGFLVRVIPERATDAEATLQHLGYDVTPLGDGSFQVTGDLDDGIEISRPLAQAGIHISELTPQKADLEQVFLALTEGEAGA